MAILAKAIITLVRVDDGVNGQDGQGVESITTEYYLSTSKTTQTGGSWTTIMPAWVTGKYLWVRSKIVYKNPTVTKYTTPYCDSSWEAASDVKDDLNNNYYNKTETDAAIKVSADKIESTVKETVTEEINNIEIGGRNLATGTAKMTIGTGGRSEGHWETIGDESSGAAENISIYDSPVTGISEGVRLLCTPVGEFGICQTGFTVVSDKIYTMTCFVKCDMAGALFYLVPWFKYGEESSEQVVFETTGEWQKVTATVNGAGQTYEDASICAIATYEISDVVSIEICGVKLEEGNKPTEWSPAPEDTATAEDVKNAQETADKAQTSAQSNEERLSVSETTIKQLSDSISMLVTDKNGSSLMTQTSNGWTFNIGAIQDTLNDASDKLNDLSGNVDGVEDTLNKLDSLIDDISKKTAYIIMTTDEDGNPCIELGKEGNPFKVRITNTSVDFMEGSNKIAYISNNSLYIEKAIIKNELQIGDGTGYIWKRRSNGNMGLRYVKG